MGEWLNEFLREAPAHDFPIFAPYYELTQEQKDYLWHGPREKVCIDSFFKMLEENQYKIQYRVMLARYRGKTTCPTCPTEKGGQLRTSGWKEHLGTGGNADYPVAGVFPYTHTG